MRASEGCRSHTCAGRRGTGATALVAVSATASLAEEITIATVNNGDMIVMQKLAPAWEEATGNTINWVVLEENVLRQRTTQDIATGGGSFDIMFIGYTSMQRKGYDVQELIEVIGGILDSEKGQNVAVIGIGASGR